MDVEIVDNIDLDNLELDNIDNIDSSSLRDYIILLTNDINNLKSIIELQACTIEELSIKNKNRMNRNRNMNSIDINDSDDNINNNINNEELITLYRNIIYNLNIERQELTTQIHDALLAVEDKNPRLALEKRFFSSQIKKLEKIIMEQNSKIDKYKNNIKELEQKVIHYNSIELQNIELNQLNQSLAYNNNSINNIIPDFENLKKLYIDLHDNFIQLQNSQSVLSENAKEYGHRWEVEVNIRQKISLELENNKKNDELRKLELNDKQALIDNLMNQLAIANTKAVYTEQYEQLQKVIDQQNQSLNMQKLSLNSKEEQINLLKVALKNVSVENHELKKAGYKNDPMQLSFKRDSDSSMSNIFKNEPDLDSKPMSSQKTLRIVKTDDEYLDVSYLKSENIHANSHSSLSNLQSNSHTSSAKSFESLNNLQHSISTHSVEPPPFMPVKYSVFKPSANVPPKFDSVDLKSVIDVMEHANNIIVEKPSLSRVLTAEKVPTPKYIPSPVLQHVSILKTSTPRNSISSQDNARRSPLNSIGHNSNSKNRSPRNSSESSVPFTTRNLGTSTPLSPSKSAPISRSRKSSGVESFSNLHEAKTLSLPSSPVNTKYVPLHSKDLSSLPYAPQSLLPPKSSEKSGSSYSALAKKKEAPTKFDVATRTSYMHIKNSKGLPITENSAFVRAGELKF